MQRFLKVCCEGRRCGQRRLIDLAAARRMGVSEDMVEALARLPGSEFADEVRLLYLGPLLCSDAAIACVALMCRLRISRCVPVYCTSLLRQFKGFASRGLRVAGRADKSWLDQSAAGVTKVNFERASGRCTGHIQSQGTWAVEIGIAERSATRPRAGEHSNAACRLWFLFSSFKGF